MEKQGGQGMNRRRESGYVEILGFGPIKIAVVMLTQPSFLDLSHSHSFTSRPLLENSKSSLSSSSIKMLLFSKSVFFKTHLFLFPSKQPSRPCMWIQWLPLFSYTANFSHLNFRLYSAHQPSVRKHVRWNTRTVHYNKLTRQRRSNRCWLWHMSSQCVLADQGVRGMCVWVCVHAT